MHVDTGFTIADAITRTAAKKPMTREEAGAMMASLLRGEATPAQVGALLMGLRLRGETEDEIVGLVEAMRAASVKIRPRRDRVMDLCGTGGDGSGTFNISTAASFVVAGAGVGVAKHGNRSASSQCGSADVLEALGVPIDLPPDRAETAIEEIGLAFLFAPLYHPAMKHVAGVRRELKIRTIFNFLGPLTNPAGVTRQLIGVGAPEMRPVLARVLQRLGSESVWIVHSDDHLDELSLGAPTSASVLSDGRIEELSVRAGDAGLSAAPIESIRGGDAAENAAILQSVLSGEAGPGPHRDAVLLNAGAALVVAGTVGSLSHGVAQARESMDSGAAQDVLERLRRFR